ncbi:efflux RND transporter permease subunit [Saliniramus sp.]|uniref:efflux RND transporter permease subunit n=1 Tax=Saliniramus sp. TaxID=2986772 RepID=UPI002CFAFCE5|nr:efflux RND transporter permease subunit [Saliniramus sp.]HMB11741.1 efflux RND transporter permease subunit [Saliniramus sp.]
MDIARAAIDKPVNTWIIVLICLLGGIWGLLTVGRLEDPSFTIKQAVVLTEYPGATAEEVEEEVTERLESAIQQLPQLNRVTSKSMPGMSEIEVEIKMIYDGTQLPQIWDELRRKVGDAQRGLPNGAGPSVVNDDFGDVFGIFYAVTTPGFSAREKREIAKFLRREVLTVPDVAKVATDGEREEAIYIEVSNERLASLGISVDQILATIQSENAAEPAGATRVGDARLRVAVRPGLDTVRAIEALRVGRPGTTEQLSLVDIAEITREPVEIPDHLVRFNGDPAFTLAVSGVADSNIVAVGQAVEAHLRAIEDRLPVGVEIHPIYEQHRVVDEAINDFIVNLALSVAIVIAVLMLFMGWRVGMVVGATLLLTVLGTVFFMRVFNIEMERISLGALIIAMGMLVDNAIVVAEGMLINMQRGEKAREAAREAARRTQVPLLGATVIGIMAFSGIGLSPDATGEFLFSLFAVIGISLLLSWVLAITVTPLFGYYLLKVAPDSHERDPYGGLIYRIYSAVLRGALRVRLLTVVALVGMTGASIWAFQFVDQAFFPESNTPLFYVNYTLPQGADIRATARDIDAITQRVMQEEGVVSVASFVGRGAARFMLTYAPEQPNTAYGQLIVRVEDRAMIAPLAARLRAELGADFPQAEVRTERLFFGPGGGARIEARFSGPDASVLRALGEEAAGRMLADGGLIDIRQDWRQRQLVITPVFNEERARIAGLGRADLAQVMNFSTTGVRAGTYREGEELIPIIARPPERERLDPGQLQDRLVASPGGGAFVPVSQIVDRFELVPEETLIRRRDRVRTLTVQADPLPGLTADEARRRILNAIERIELPPGYRLEWGGEYQASAEAEESLGRQLPLGFLVMLIISILLFGRIRQPLIIWLVVPMSVCGVVLGLLGSGLAFGFMALLGFLSLSGMLMKNAIVLVDEIDAQIASGRERFTALVDASVSRLRPVTLAAVTTILGMAPLLTDAFFANMAVTIMAGLAFASVLTLVAVPVLYAIFFRIRRGNDAVLEPQADDVAQPLQA